MGELREAIRASLERHIAESGYSQKEIAEKLGVSKSSITNWIKGKNSPDVELVLPICKLLNISVREFYGETNAEEPGSTKKASSDLSEEAHRIAKKFDLLSEHGKGAVRAILNYEQGSNIIQLEQPAKIHQIEKVIPLSHAQDKASAGTGFQLSDDKMDSWMVVYNEQTRKADFCVDVVGNSMEPLYHDGDTILVRQQPSVDVGEIGLFIVDGKGYVKRQGTDCLESINSEYKDIYPSEYSEVECMGKVLGVLQEDWIVKA